MFNNLTVPQGKSPAETLGSFMIIQSKDVIKGIIDYLGFAALRLMQAGSFFKNMIDDDPKIQLMFRDYAIKILKNMVQLSHMNEMLTEYRIRKKLTTTSKAIMNTDEAHISGLGPVLGFPLPIPNFRVSCVQLGLTVDEVRKGENYSWGGALSNNCSFF